MKTRLLLVMIALGAAVATTAPAEASLIICCDHTGCHWGPCR